MAPRPADSSVPVYLPRMKGAPLKRERPVQSTKSAPGISKVLLKLARLGRSVVEEQREEPRRKWITEMGNDEKPATAEKAASQSDIVQPDWTCWRKKGTSFVPATRPASLSAVVVREYWRKYEAAQADGDAVDALNEYTEGVRRLIKAEEMAMKAGGCTSRGKTKAEELYLKRCPVWVPLQDAGDDDDSAENESANEGHPLWNSLENADEDTNEIRHENKEEKVDESCSPRKRLRDPEEPKQVAKRRKVQKRPLTLDLDQELEPVLVLEHDPEIVLLAPKIAQNIEEIAPEVRLMNLTGTSLLSLADELLSRIFLHITEKKDQRRVNLTCRRFRTLNLLVGSNHFSTIDVDWRNGQPSLRGLLGGATLRQIDLPLAQTGEEPSCIIKSCADERRIFKNAIVDTMTVKFQDCAMPTDQASSSIMSSLCGTMKFKKLVVCFDSEQDFTEEFHNVFIKDHDLKEASIHISWTAGLNHNVGKARELVTFPRSVNKYEIDWKVQKGIVRRMPAFNIDEQILDDDSLLLLMRTSTEANVQAFGNYTADGILAVFDAMIHLPYEGKRIKIHVEENLINDIFRVAQPVLYRIKTSGCFKYLTQLTTNTWLTATANKIIIEQKAKP